LSFYKAIKDAAKAANQSCSLTDKQPDEDIVRTQMVEAIGRSLQPNPPTLPSVTYTITINGEAWHVILSATAIPHFRAAVVEWGPKSDQEIVGRFQLARSLFEGRVAGFAKVENNQLHGKTWELYLFCKIGLLNNLRGSLSREPFQRKTVLLAPDRVFSQLGASMPIVSTFQNSPEAIREFLDGCDHIMTERVEPAELVRYLQESPVSLKQFLHAQRRSILGMRF
jgi:hypothetical protein